MAASDPTTEEGRHPAAVLAEGPVETACRWLVGLALATMILVIATEILTRYFFNFSFEVADELGGYMLVAVAFFSLAVCQVNDGFHRVEFVQNALSPRAQTISRIAFDACTFVFAGLLAWQYGRLELAAWQSGNTAPTYLMTPLWLAQLPMLLGMLAFMLAIVRTIAMRVRILKSMRPAGGRA